MLLAALARPSAAATFELRADTLTTNTAAQTVIARGHVRVTDGMTTARAGSARYAVRLGRLVLADGVVVQSPDGLLRAREVTILLSGGRQIKLVTADGAVHAETRGRTLVAERVTYEPSTGAVSASGGVSLFAPPDLRATGRDLVANLRREVATLTGHARVQSSEGFLEGDRIDADGRTQTALVRDHVVGAFRKIQLSADTATVGAREHKAVFRGNVKIVDPTRTVLADQVTVYYQDGRIVAEGATSVRVEDDRR